MFEQQNSPYAKTRTSQRPGDRRNMTLYGSFNFSKKEKPSQTSKHGGCHFTDELYMFDESPLNVRTKQQRRNGYEHKSSVADSHQNHSEEDLEQYKQDISQISYKKKI